MQGAPGVSATQGQYGADDDVPGVADATVARTQLIEAEANTVSATSTAAALRIADVIALTVCEVCALSHLNNISVRITDVVARLAVLGDRLGDENLAAMVPHRCERDHVMRTCDREPKR